MKQTLLPKELVKKEGRPMKFVLTDKGRKLAKLLHKSAAKLDGNDVSVYGKP